jgi:hypothetical protein
MEALFADFVGGAVGGFVLSVKWSKFKTMLTIFSVSRNIISRIFCAIF